MSRIQGGVPHTNASGLDSVERERAREEANAQQTSKASTSFYKNKRFALAKKKPLRKRAKQHPLAKHLARHGRKAHGHRASHGHKAGHGHEARHGHKSHGHKSHGHGEHDVEHEDQHSERLQRFDQDGRNGGREQDDAQEDARDDAQDKLKVRIKRGVKAASPEEFNDLQKLASSHADHPQVEQLLLAAFVQSVSRPELERARATAMHGTLLDLLKSRKQNGLYSGADYVDLRWVADELQKVFDKPRPPGATATATAGPDANGRANLLSPLLGLACARPYTPFQLDGAIARREASLAMQTQIASAG